MAGREGIRQRIEHLKEQLAKTKSEKRKKAIREEIEGLKSGRSCMAGTPRNHPITARKTKPKKEDLTLPTQDKELEEFIEYMTTGCYRIEPTPEIRRYMEDLEKQLVKEKNMERRIAIHKKLLPLRSLYCSIHKD